MDKLTAYRLLIAVAELGSFTRAGKAFDLPQPRVSKVIRDLEAELGVQLLIRSTRQVKLTAEGADFLERLKDGLELLAAAEDDLRGSVQSPRGNLRVTAPVGFGQHWVAPAIREYLLQYPEASAALDLTDRFVDLTEGRYDVAVRIGEVEGASLRIARVGTCPMRIVAAPSYVNAATPPAHPSDLAAHLCLVYSSWREANVWRLTSSEGTETVHVGGRFHSSHLPSLRDAAVAGFGIANLPAWLVDDTIDNGHLVHVLPNWSAADIAINAVLPPGHTTPLRARLFIDLLRKWLRAGGYGP